MLQLELDNLRLETRFQESSPLVVESRQKLDIAKRALDAERADHRPGGFATGHDQPAHALGDQASCDLSERILDHAARMLAAELVLHGLDLLRRGGGVDQNRPLAQPRSRPCQRLAGHVLYNDPALRPSSDVLRRGNGGQPMLWTHGISGGLPSVTVRR